MTALIYGDECVSKDTDKFDQPISRLYDVIILIANPSRFMIIIITAVTDAWRLCQQDRTMRESVSGQQIFSIALRLVSAHVKMQIQIQAQIQIQINTHKYSTKYNK